MIQRSDLGLVVPFFDAAKSPRMLANLSTALDAIDAAGMRRHTILAECLFPDRRPAGQAYADAWTWLPVAGDLLWQKERLIQLGCEALADLGYAKVAYLDADFLFLDEDWPAALSAALDRWPVVQSYETLAAEFEDETLEDLGALARWQAKQKCDGRFAGGSWAYRAEVVRRLPIYQYNVVGGGDSTNLWAATWPEKCPMAMVGQYSEPMNDHIRTWIRRLRGVLCARDFGYANLRARCLPHGTRLARQYQARHAILKPLDPYEDLLTVRGQGIRWTARARERKPEMIRQVANYLAARAV